MLDTIISAAALVALLVMASELYKIRKVHERMPEGLDELDQTIAEVAGAGVSAINSVRDVVDALILKLHKQGTVMDFSKEIAALTAIKDQLAGDSGAVVTEGEAAIHEGDPEPPDVPAETGGEAPPISEQPAPETSPETTPVVPDNPPIEEPG